MTRIRLPREVLAPLRGPATGANLFAIAFDLTVIAGAIVGSQLWNHPLGYPLAAILIGARQHGLLVMMHEASHGLLFRDRRLNERVGQLLLAWPLFASLTAYRANHVAHHGHLNTAADPDWARYFDPESPLNDRWKTPVPAPRLLGRLLKDAVGLGVLDQLRRVRAFGGGGGAGISRTRLLYYAAFAVGFTLLGVWPWVLLYWILPMLTWLPMALRLRLWAEHNLPDGMGTRTVVAGPLGRLLIAPHGIAWHTEHHAFPSISIHRLHRVHAALRAQGVFEQPERRLTHGYLAVLGELSRPAEAPKP